MATSTGIHLTSRDINTSDYGSDIDVRSIAASEYGSDFDVEDETLVGDLLTHLATTAPTTPVVAAGKVEEDAAAATALVYKPPAFVPATAARIARDAALSLQRGEGSVSVEIESDSPSTQTWTAPRAVSAPPGRIATSPMPSIEPLNNELDTRSPLERFRTKPKKPLSVTDLVSPAWCELQYLYTLVKFGRKPRTAAMKQGSKVHRVLEEQVHEIIPVEIKSKEDGFGLKIWNTIQGLRTLRQTGLTRELEVWGIIDGQVVNGVIDEVSYTCPDPEFEERLENSTSGKAGGTLPLGQLSIEQSFTDPSAWVGRLQPDRVVYLADVKTRNVKSVPASMSLRPTQMQLMLYRKLLKSLSTNVVDAETVFSRYNLEPLDPFTDVFMQELVRLDAQQTIPFDDSNPFSILTPSDIQAHNNLSALWSLMISEFSMTIDTLSDVLRAEFRFAKTGELIGSEVFAYETKAIEDYIAAEMGWWRGKREAKGVEIEEAFKCRICDFATDCTWRKNKIEEATEKHRLRLAERARSAV